MASAHPMNGSSHEVPTPPQLRVVFFSLEYLGPVFSGNGMYSRSLVRGLQSRGVPTCVVSGRREDTPPDLAVSEPHVILDVPIPHHRWNRLDQESGWREFVDGIVTNEALLNNIIDFKPDVIAAVDWHGMAVVDAVREKARVASKLDTIETALATIAALPAVYLNFRIYSTSPGLFADKPEEAAFFRAQENTAILQAVASVSLCRQDAISLLLLSQSRDPLTGKPFRVDGSISDDTDAPPRTSKTPDIRVLLPPLRKDIATIAATADFETGHRNLVSCLVRQSPEKNAHLFGQLCTSAVGSKAMAAHKLRPFLCGAAGDAEYAEAVRTAIRSMETLTDGQVSGQVVTSFMGPSELKDVLLQSIVNVHPAYADAYGMTIVEAAAFGVPTLVQRPDASITSSGNPLAFEALQVNTKAQLEDRKIGAKGGYMKLILRDDGKPDEYLEAAIDSRYPPVGACDLLGDPSSNAGEDTDGTTAIIGMDWKGDAAALEARFAQLIAQPDILQDAGRRAQAIALSWQEDLSSASLEHILSDALPKPKAIK